MDQYSPLRGPELGVKSLSLIMTIRNLLPQGIDRNRRLQLEYLCWFVKASYGVKHCGDSSDDHEFHFFAMLSFEKCFNV